MMIDFSVYRNIVPQTKIVNKKSNTEVKTIELPCFDFIYECTTLEKDKYPYGVFVTGADGESVLNCLYGSISNYYTIYNTNPITPTKGLCGDLVIPMFVIKDNNDNLIDADSFNYKSYFSEDVKRYSDMTDMFKVTSDGFFQVENSTRCLNYIVPKITKKNYSCKNVSPSYDQYLTKFKINKIIGSFYIQFLTDKDIEHLYQKNDLYEFVEQYVFCCVNKTNNYIYSKNIEKYVSDADAIVEPMLVDEEDGTIPQVRYHAIFFPCRYRYKHFLGNITTKERKRHIEVLTFYSSEADDPINMFFKKTYNLLINANIKLTSLIQRHNINNSIKATYTVSLNPLKNNTRLIDNHLNNGIFIPIDIPTHIKGYGVLNMRSTSVFEVRENYFNIVKLKTEKEASHISEITVNKYYLDVQADDDCNIHLNDLIYSVYIDNEKHT